MQGFTIDSFEQELAKYKLWLPERGLSERTQRAYQSRVQQFLNFLASSSNGCKSLSEERALIESIFEYWDFLKNVKKTRPGSVNNNLTAIDNFCEFLGLKHLRVTSLRESAPAPSAKSLTTEEQLRFLQAVERRRSMRDKALALLLYYTGIKIGECFALDVDDVALTSHTGKIKVQSNDGKRNASRELVLNEITRKALLAWLIERSEKSVPDSETALFLNSRCNRLAIAGIDFVIRSIGWNARIGLSAQILRRTFLVNQLNSGQSAGSVAQIAGHKGPETIRRYLGHTGSAV